MATLDAVHGYGSLSRRTRPPNLDIYGAEENRIPLKQQKLDRRESRLGLRNIFGRSRATKEAQTPDPSEMGSIRESIVHLGSVPYEDLSEASISPRHVPRPMSISVESAGPDEADRDDTNLRGKRKPNGTKSSRQPRAAPSSNSEFPPLFKAYPQAVRYATLPASNMSPDAILRLHEKHGKLSPRKNSQSPSNEFPEDHDSEKDNGTGKAKGRHSRDPSMSSLKSDWTTKIYILSTSGYLLQYASDGAFDRLPEKALRLGKLSAAFASDIIPGRHWVLQVLSTTESDGTPSSDSRSIFSRLTFRNTERRGASTFLMVFESAGDMDVWIATLRREIEQLGGKKNLSETGKPKSEETPMRLREQPSQRTLVVKDPDRFSRVMSQDLSWDDEFDLEQEDDGALTETDTETIHDPSLDDISTTNSIPSHDGRQLDRLRDSANRLSYLSSGQRTVVTSAGSSPACSPTMDAFPTHLEDSLGMGDIRPRPNAHAIVDRRRSMQTMSPFVEGTPGSSGGAGSRKSITEFATPPTAHLSGSYFPAANPPRLSYAGAFSDLEASIPASPDSDTLSRGSIRRSPPTALRLSRPLSMVVDQPSPKETVPQRPVTRHDDKRSPMTTEDERLSQPRLPSRNLVQARLNLPSRRSSLMPVEQPQRFSVQVNPRRLSSLGAIAAHGETMPPKSGPAPMPLPSDQPRLRPPPRAGWDERPERCRSSMDLREGARSREPMQPRISQRSSMYSAYPNQPGRRSFVADARISYIAEAPPPPMGPPPAVPLPPIPSASTKAHLRVNVTDRALYTRKSMPHLVSGPPRAPPPSCALPPIPQRMPVRI